ncbi:Rhamnan synthesis protein F [anaerobic digester metagenome]
MQERDNNAVIHRPRRIAMYVIYDKDGKLDRFRKYYLQELRKEVDTIVGVVSGTLTPESRDELAELTDDFFVRENKGLLAGSWIDGIAHIGWDTLAEYDELLMLNDSFFGPFYPLSEMFDAMEKSDADFYGCMQNFEQKQYTSMAGRPMKHGHFMGSICYFYIIKYKLLHSPEFKSYWSKMPEIKEDWDTYFFAEIDFYQYVKNAGFRIDAYQGNDLEGYFFDNLTHNMRKEVIDERIPFARQRPFCTDMKDQSQQINYGQDPRLTLEYIERQTDYDATMIWDYILRTKNLTDIFNQLQLEYVVPKTCVEKPFSYDKRIAVILHIYYEDQVEIIADYCKNFTEKTDFYITTTNEETEAAIIEAFDARKLQYECQIRPNVGVAMSTLWITYADITTSGKYEYICYFHDKKSPYSQFAVQGEQFATLCYENLFGSPAVVKNIINLLEENPRMGVVGAPMVYHSEYYMVASRSWPGNYPNTVDLAKTLDINADINPNKYPVAPYGDMMWFRADALKKAIGHGFTYDDFDIKYKPDFTILHAIERIYGLAAQDSGYYYAEVINSDWARSDLVNYRYMLQTLSWDLWRRGYYYGNFEYLHQLASTYIPKNGVPYGTSRRFLYWLIGHKATHHLGLFLQRCYRRWFKKN